MKIKIRKWLLFGAAMLLLILLARTVPAGASEHALPAAPAAAEAGSGVENSESRKELVITVVEDIPAEEIEENAVPLAASAEEQNQYRSLRISLIIAAAGVCLFVLFYYFVLRDRKMRRSILRMENTREPGQKKIRS